MLREGIGADIVAAIREAPRAVVFISVPWSGPERNAREVFRTAASRLEVELPELDIRCFRLDVDDDVASQKWLASIGLPEFASAGAGSLVWLEGGRVVASEITANSLGTTGVVARSKLLWHGRA